MQVPMSHWRQQSKKNVHVLIDTGMNNNCGFNQDKWKVKYWARNILVICLYSAVTVGKILLVEGQKNQTTQVALYFSLFFIRVQLVAVNFKGKLQDKERVVMLWSSLLFFLHIDGFHITTKRNLLSKCVSLYLLIMRSDIVEPHILTYKPYERTNTTIRGM